jgi:uncharacterized Zn finger protein (UPF0148 family)
MTGDICECGICAIETCDLCGQPVAFVDDEGEAWCAECHARYQENRAEAVWLRQWEAGQ